MIKKVLTEHVQKCKGHHKVSSPVEYGGDGEGPAFDASWKNFT